MLINLLFNSFGYRIVSYLIEQRVNTIAEIQLDNNNYKEADLIEIKVPFKLPYSTEWKEFERIDGEIEVDGKFYKYVKRKVIVDSLVLLCLPNDQKAKLESAHGRFFELVHGLKQPHQKKSESSSVFKSLISVYIARENHWSLQVVPQKSDNHIIKNSTLLTQFNFQKLIKPPNSWA
jgi:hypothetical protein